MGSGFLTSQYRRLKRKQFRNLVSRRKLEGVQPNTLRRNYLPKVHIRFSAAFESCRTTMKAHLPSRLRVGAALLLLSVAVPALALQHKSAPPPAVKQYRPEPRPQIRPEAATGNRVGQNQEPHLKQWIENHRNLSPTEQQRQLENEPGFRELPPQTQQRYRDELNRLNNMPPQQRDRMLERNEQLERLSPAQRQEWRGAVQQLNGLPGDRKRLVARSILDLRIMPPGQREQVIDSPAFAAQFSDSERSTIRTLLTAEPYPPAQ